MQTRKLAKYCFYKAQNAVNNVVAGNRSAAKIDLEDIRDKLNADFRDKERKRRKMIEEIGGE